MRGAAMSGTTEPRWRRASRSQRDYGQLPKPPAVGVVTMIASPASNTV
ncbi:hypothetical protein FHT71_003133 [Rhizobium sp. BK060]|nr:hypothetical protein [Rhizobium sp. BK060]